MNLKTRLLQRLLFSINSFIPDALYLKWIYRIKMGRRLNLNDPLTFTEKIQWLKLNDRKPQYTSLVDKYAVKKIVAARIGEQYIIPTIGEWSSVDEIDWKALPNQFVLKTTHGGGSGGVIVCNDKSRLDIDKAKKKLKKSMNTEIYPLLREWPYKNVTKKIIAEKYLSDHKNKDLIDYKWYCFNGEPRFCQVIRDRNSSETIDFYDEEWGHQEFTGLLAIDDNIGMKPLQEPATLKEQFLIAKELSKDLSPFVRVDLYEIEGKVYFGELTFYPASGLGFFEPKEWDLKLGQMIRLPLSV